MLSRCLRFLFATFCGDTVFNRGCAQLGVNLEDVQAEEDNRSKELIFEHPRYVQRLVALVLILGICREASHDPESDPENQGS